MDGDFQPGDRLPSERELQRDMDVSRGTLRESIRVLEQKGLVEVRTGAKGGIFVRTMNTDTMADTLSLFVRSQKVSLSHLAQFREDLEGVVALRAAERATEDDKQELLRLRELFLALREKGLSSWDEMIDADRQVHVLLPKIAGNPVHKFFLETVHENLQLKNIDKYLPRTNSIFTENCDDMAEVTLAVVEGRGEDARAVILRHVSRFNSYMESQVGE